MTENGRFQALIQLHQQIRAASTKEAVTEFASHFCETHLTVESVILVETAGTIHVRKRVPSGPKTKTSLSR